MKDGIHKRGDNWIVVNRDDTKPDGCELIRVFWIPTSAVVSKSNLGRNHSSKDDELFRYDGPGTHDDEFLPF